MINEQKVAAIQSLISQKLRAKREQTAHHEKREEAERKERLPELIAALRDQIMKGNFLIEPDRKDRLVIKAPFHYWMGDGEYMIEGLSDYGIVRYCGDVKTNAYGLSPATQIIFEVQGYTWE